VINPGLRDAPGYKQRRVASVASERARLRIDLIDAREAMCQLGMETPPAQASDTTAHRVARRTLAFLMSLAGAFRRAGASR
jgi:hypothetical protein